MGAPLQAGAMANLLNRVNSPLAAPGRGALSPIKQDSSETAEAKLQKIKADLAKAGNNTEALLRLIGMQKAAELNVKKAKHYPEFKKDANDAKFLDDLQQLIIAATDANNVFDTSRIDFARLANKDMPAADLNWGRIKQAAEQMGIVFPPCTPRLNPDGTVDPNHFIYSRDQRQGLMSNINGEAKRKQFNYERISQKMQKWSSQQNEFWQQIIKLASMLSETIQKRASNIGK